MLKILTTKMPKLCILKIIYIKMHGTLHAELSQNVKKRYNAGGKTEANKNFRLKTRSE